mmetsp:Transcript_28624/g.66576  ORF Transcript_28624/g.66576 Transcript_28624/m.66576 type:complete len:214 (+) Transcript_28624:474-1115(+)
MREPHSASRVGRCCPRKEASSTCKQVPPLSLSTFRAQITTNPIPSQKMNSVMTPTGAEILLWASMHGSRFVESSPISHEETFITTSMTSVSSVASGTAGLVDAFQEGAGGITNRQDPPLHWRRCQAQASGRHPNEVEVLDHLQGRLPRLDSLRPSDRFPLHRNPSGLSRLTPRQASAPRLSRRARASAMLPSWAAVVAPVPRAVLHLPRTRAV